MEITKKHIEGLLEGFIKDSEMYAYGSVGYWQTKGAINLLESLLEVYFK